MVELLLGAGANPDLQDKVYHIALNFWGSKFSQMVVFKDFTEIIPRILCLNHVHAAHVMYYRCAIQAEFYLTSTVMLLSALELAPVSKAMPILRRYLFWEHPLWIWQLSPLMLSINAFAHEKCSSSVIEIMCQWLKIHEIKDPQKCSTIQYMNTTRQLYSFKPG